MDAVIRKLKKEDAKQLAHAMTLVWNSTYKGIIEEEYLNSLYEKEEETSKRIEKQALKNQNYYVLVKNEKIIGWTFFDYETDKYEDSAEIYSLYVLKEYQKKGYGKLLFDFAVRKIKKQKIDKLVIGCLDKNPSNDFYKHMGGTYIKTSLFKEKYNENIYLFYI